VSAVALVPVDLPPPDALRGRWAAFAAICAARGWDGSCHADGPRWHFDDGGGNWADLVHVGDGRAVLLGHDHEYSETYYADAAAYFGEPETDLLAGAPDWWAPPVRAAATPESWVGFAYGFDGARWSRAPYDLEDGFGSVGLPALDEAAYRDLAGAFTQDAPGRGDVPDDAAFDALATAGPDVSVPALRVVVGPAWDAEAGVAAARRFRP
jgi:hypothetical protein